MNETIQAPAGTTTTNSRKNMWIIVALIAVIVLVIIVVVLLMAQNNKDTNTTDDTNVSVLSPNTCPDDITNISGKSVAVLNGNNLEMSLETYNWVITNCNLDGDTEEVPVLANLGIQIEGFDGYDVMTGRAGAFIFDANALNGNSPVNKVLIEFGASVQGEDGEKVLPEITYNQVDSDTNIIAMTNGKVVEVSYQEFSDDYAVVVLFNDLWAIEYDHLRDVLVEVNDQVEEGDVLGKVALNRDAITGFAEIAIKNVKGNDSKHYCPVNYLSEDIIEVYESKISALMLDWETYTGDSTIYDEASQVVPGCLLEMVSE